MFSRFGVPDKVRSDNGGCYASEAFFYLEKNTGLNIVPAAQDIQKVTG